MENEREIIENELADEANQEKISINNERYSKYKDVFDKHKNQEGYINNEDVNDILNEFGRKTTIEDTNELINFLIF